MHATCPPFKPKPQIDPKEGVGVMSLNPLFLRQCGHKECIFLLLFMVVSLALLRMVAKPVARTARLLALTQWRHQEWVAYKGRYLDSAGKARVPGKPVGSYRPCKASIVSRRAAGSFLEPHCMPACPMTNLGKADTSKMSIS